MKKKILGILAFAGLSILTACGEQTEGKIDIGNITDAVSTNETNDAAGDDEVRATGVVSQRNAKTVNFKEAEGDWICLAELSCDPEYNPEENLTIYDDMYSSKNVSIYEEDGKTKIDYVHEGENVMEIYGCKFLEEDAEGYKNFYHKKTESDFMLDAKLEDPDTLVIRQQYIYDGYKTVYLNYFKRVDSDIEAALDAYRYKETITVSNVKELYNAIGSNRKIILKEGVYNFSELALEDKNNPNVNTSTDYYTYPLDWGTMAQAWCIEVDYLCLQGEEGAEVEICTEDGFLAPLVFNVCNHITLDNLKIGHWVEPGYCAGSVIYLDSARNVDIKNCRLYGSGTYGIEANYSGNIRVTDTDIYECSYGLINFISTSEVTFENCTLRDSKDYQMFFFTDSAWGIHFNNCTITNNDSSTFDLPFIDSSNAWGDIYFDNCEFTNNKYSTLCAGDNVTFTNCTIR